MFLKNKNGDEEFGVFIAISVALHLFIFILFTYGLPSLFNSPPEPQVITFEILPVDAISNVKTQKIQQEKEIEETAAKKVQKTKQPEKLRQKQEYTKPSVAKRSKKLKAVYKQQLFSEQDKSN